MHDFWACCWYEHSLHDEKIMHALRAHCCLFWTNSNHVEHWLTQTRSLIKFPLEIKAAYWDSCFVLSNYRSYQEVFVSPLFVDKSIFILVWSIFESDSKCWETLLIFDTLTWRMLPIKGFLVVVIDRHSLRYRHYLCHWLTWRRCSQGYAYRVPGCQRALLVHSVLVVTAEEMTNGGGAWEEETTIRQKWGTHLCLSH